MLRSCDASQRLLTNWQKKQSILTVHQKGGICSSQNVFFSITVVNVMLNPIKKSNLAKETADVKLKPLLVMSISKSRGATRAEEPAQSRSGSISGAWGSQD